MSAYIRCDKCGCESLDVDTLRCTCDGAITLTHCDASERFDAELSSLRARLVAEEARRAADLVEYGRRLAAAEAALAGLREVAAAASRYLAAEHETDLPGRPGLRKARAALDAALARVTP